MDELEHAMAAYRAWIRKFNTMLACRTEPDPGDLAADSYLGRDFANWHHGQVNRFLESHPGFAEAGGFHREMHDLARGLAETTAAGGEVSLARYEAFNEGVDRFKRSMRKLLNEAWELLRYTDPLTGVANRFVLLPRLEQERERSRRSGRTCSIAMMDLDRFKAVNDTHGHHAGDRVLQYIARYLLDNVRRYDQFYRYGGEEFVVMLPNTASGAAKGVLDRLRRGLKRQRIPLHDGSHISISASFGIAELAPDQPVKTVIDRADAAMYAAKKAGRNRVHVWQGGDQP